MKKRTNPVPIPPITSVIVDNYTIDSWVLHLSTLYKFKAPLSCDAPAVLKADGIPFELAELINRRIKHAFSSQSAYEQFIALLLTPSV